MHFTDRLRSHGRLADCFIGKGAVPLTKRSITPDTGSYARPTQMSEEIILSAPDIVQFQGGRNTPLKASIPAVNAVLPAFFYKFNVSVIQDFVRRHRCRSLCVHSGHSIQKVSETTPPLIWSWERMKFFIRKTGTNLRLPLRRNHFY